MEVKIRKATAADCKFIAELIFLAESTGAEITSYEKMFGKPASELIPTFEKNAK